MHPASLLSYYPNYALLDEVLSQGNYSELNIYIDLKNNLQTTYMEHAILNILESSKKSRFIDTSVFSSLLSFLSFHKIYSKRRNIKINFFVFFESGISYYHKNISKTYKISRRIDDLYGLDREDRDLFFKILGMNFSLIEHVFNRIPSVKILRLLNLEADFLPYYMIRNNLVNTSSDSAHIIYSNDHDLLQCIRDNCFVFRKMGKVKKLVKKNEVMKEEMKRETNLPDIYQPIAMSIIGDTGDDVDGVKTIGPKRCLDIFPEFMKAVGGIRNLYDNVMKSKDIIDLNSYKTRNKYMKLILKAESDSKLISRNLKLVSFELISREIDNPSNTEIIKKRDHIHKILSDTNIAPIEVIRATLDKGRVFITGDELDNLYY